jgi:hypothetical protein
MNQLADFDEPGAGPAPRTSVVALPAAPAPAAMHEARRTPTESAYVDAWLKAQGQRR